MTVDGKEEVMVDPAEVEKRKEKRKKKEGERGDAARCSSVAKKTGIHKELQVDSVLAEFIGKETCSRPEVGSFFSFHRSTSSLCGRTSTST